MKREGYLATLSLITVLLLTELDNSGSDFGLTEPPWIGAVSWLVWLVSHYTILGSIVLCVVTAVSALLTGTPSRIVLPTVLAGIGTLFYLINNAVEDVMRWFNFERVTIIVNGVTVPVGYGTIPNNYKVVYYVVNAVPFWLFVLTIVPLSLYTHQRHLYDKENLAMRGITYDDAEQEGLNVEAQAKIPRQLTLLLRGERHRSALPGLYTSAPCC